MAVVAVFVFLLLRLTAGDPAAIIAGDNATARDVAFIREKLGLNQPLAQQFVIWLGRILRGDFGESFFFKRTVADLIVARLEPTLALTTCTLVLAVLIAVPLGVTAAYKRGSWIDRANLVSVRSHSIYGIYDVDFTAFGFDCRPQRGTPLAGGRNVSPDSAEVVLNPQTDHGGVALVGRFSGDSIAGVWYERRSGGSSGRFVMRRE